MSPSASRAKLFAALALGSAARIAARLAWAAEARWGWVWTRSCYFRLAKAMLRANALSNRARLALWISKSGHPAPGWGARGLAPLASDPRWIRSPSAGALLDALIGDRSSMSDPAQLEDALLAAKLKARQSAGTEFASLSADRAMSELGQSNPALAEAFRRELSELDPSWHRRGLPPDPVGELLSKDSELAARLLANERRQESLLEAEGLAAETARGRQAPAPPSRRI